MGQRSSELHELSLQCEALGLEIAQRALHVLGAFGPSRVARGGELLRIPDPREAIALMPMATRPAGPGTEEQRRGSVAVLLQHALH